MGRDKGRLTPGKVLGFRAGERMLDEGASDEEAAEVRDVVTAVIEAVTGDEE